MNLANNICRLCHRRFQEFELTEKEHRRNTRCKKGRRERLRLYIRFSSAVARFFLESLPCLIALLLKLRCYFRQPEITFIYIEICILYICIRDSGEPE
jgi:hypothetical protein